MLSKFIRKFFSCCIPVSHTRKRKAISKKVARAVFHRCQGHCFYCYKTISKAEPRIGIYEIDHLEPFSNHNAPDDISNYFVACFQCNRKKSNLPLHVFLQRNGLQKRCQYLQIDDTQNISLTKATKNNHTKRKILNGVYCMQICSKLDSKFCNHHSSWF